MSTTSTTFVRFVASGLTWAGTVRRQGHVLAVPADSDPDGIMSMSEKDQRAKWGRAFYEILTEEEYAEAAGAPSITPEAARLPRTPPPPGADADVTRGGDAIPATSPPSHTPPAPDAEGGEAAPPAPAPPIPEPDAGAARWPWYADANVADTLGKVADMPETEAMDFLAYEQAHKARTSVLGPMKGN